MKIVLKGVEIPKNCYSCPLGFMRYEKGYRWGFEKREYACCITGKGMTSTKRNRFCPIVDEVNDGFNR